MVAIVSAFTFPTTISSLILDGFEVKMADVVNDGFVIDPNELENRMDGVSLIVPTHFLGFPADMKHICDIAHKHGAYILQDAFETINLLDGKKQYFEYGDIITWSFYHPHHLSSYGGGAVITLTEEDAFLVDSIAHWGRKCKCHFDPERCKAPSGAAHQFSYERLGLNIEISELNACFGRWQLITFEEQEKIRKDHYSVLYKTLYEVKNIRVYEHQKIFSKTS